MDQAYILRLSVALANLLEVINNIPSRDMIIALAERNSGIYHSIEVAQAVLNQPR